MSRLRSRTLLRLCSFLGCRGPLALLAILALIAPLAPHSTRAQGSPPVPFPIVFVSRQIPDRGTIYWDVPKDQPGVGGHSRFRPAAPGQLLVREIDGTIRTLIDGATASAATLDLVDVNAPDVSYDGQWIAFAGLRSGSHPTGPGAHPGAWRIYVIHVNGSGLRQVTPEEDRSAIAIESLRGYDDTDPAWLPDGRLVFSSTRWPSYAQYSGVRTSNLYVIAADGGLRRITAERNGADRPLIDPITGKIVYARWWRNHRFGLDDESTVADPNGGYIQKDGLSAHRDSQITGEPGFANYLWRNAWQAATINPDGTGLAMWSGIFRDEEANHAYGGSFSADGTFFANFFPTINMTEAGGFGGIRKLSRGPHRYTPVAGVTTLSNDYVRVSNPTSFGVFPGPYVTEPEALPDGRLIVSVAADVQQDYGLYVMNADGSGPQALIDVPGATELRVRAIRARPLPPIVPDLHTRVPAPGPPGATGPYDVDGTFVFDALNVYFNAPVDIDIVSAPPVGSAATLRFFIDHQRTSPGSFPNLDWPILLKSLPISPGGAVRENAAPASVPLFEQVRSAGAPGAGARVPLTGGPYPDGAAHVTGMNFAPAGSVARCVGCHAGHTMIPVPPSLEAAKWTNLAPGARVEVSSTRDARYNAGLIDRRVLKGEIWRYWTAASGQHANQWAKLTFPVPIAIRAVRLYNPRAGDDAHSSLSVQQATVRLFRDEAATQEVAAKSTGPLAVSGTDIDFMPTVARAVRVDLGTVTGTFYGARTAGLAEIEVIASGDAGPSIDPVADDDRDGMPDGWETDFGFDPSDPQDASGDADQDGVTNRDEYVRGAHPRGLYTRYFAEGAANDFFETTIALLNPGEAAARVVLRFLQSDGPRVSHSRSMSAHSRATIDARTILGAGDFATILESDRPIVADRTITWAAGQRYGSHAEGSVPAPAVEWYLAEGATHGAFDLFYLLQNPNDNEARVRVRYLLASGAPLEKTYVVPPVSRRTIWVDDELFDVAGGPAQPLLSSTDVSAVMEVLNGTPIVVERAMYMSRPDALLAAGHESAGVTAPATHWFLAEGATGPFFDCYILLANPTVSPADVRMTYLVEGGGTRTRVRRVRGNGRVTINVADETFDDAPGERPLAFANVSTVVESLNDVPIIVERSMWWPSFGSDPAGWTEAHNSPGTTEAGIAWAAAGGELDASRGAETFLLIANTSSVAGSARVTLMFEDGATLERDVQLPSNSRTTVNVRDAFPAAEGRRFGAVITSKGETPAPIVVERAMYANADGITWAAGTNIVATMLK
jgi:hypothetical protein